MSIEQRLTDAVKKIAKAVVTDISTSLIEATDYKTLDAAEKVRIVKAMGFTATGSDHDDGCPALFSSGYNCNCIPPATYWMQPPDVDEVRGETFDQRREKALKRDRVRRQRDV